MPHDATVQTGEGWFSLSAMTLMGAVILLGFYFGKGTSRARLPSLIGYMLLGVLMGPSLLNVFTEQSMLRLGWVTEAALGFVAFSIGSELSLRSLRQLGFGIVAIILTESFLVFAVVAGSVYLLTGDVATGLLFGAVAPASAPTGTVAIIQEYKAKGTLTKALYAVVGFDDGLAIIIFGFALAIARSLLTGEYTGVQGSILPSLITPAIEIGGSLIAGAVIGIVFCNLVRYVSSSSEYLILIVGTVLLTTGICLNLGLSLILTNMVVGFTLVNTRRESLVHRVTQPMLDIMPLLFIPFFCLAGAHLDLTKLPALGLLGLVYVVARSAGLLAGARIGAEIGRSEPKIKKYLGLGILSQAGVAIGLSLIVLSEFQSLSLELDGWEKPVAIAGTVLTTITATSIIFEIIGPILTKIALEKAGEIPKAEPAPKRGHRTS